MAKKLAEGGKGKARGAVSKVAGTISSVANSLAKVPIIGSYAGAIAGAADMAGDIAAFFGFTRQGEEPRPAAVFDVGYNNPAATEGDTMTTHS